jgi:hypothetical protein
LECGGLPPLLKALASQRTPKATAAALAAVAAATDSSLVLPA